MHLRPFLKQLEEQEKLVRIKKEVTVEYEIANIIYTLNEKPVIFEKVKGYPFPIFGGITSDRDIIAQGLGTTKEKLLLKLVEALRHPKAPEIVEKGPCQEVDRRVPPMIRPLVIWRWRSASVIPYR
jgi:2,5-furandicarboxylate decarboxylase 1